MTERRCTNSWQGSADGFQEHACEREDGHIGPHRCACGDVPWSVVAATTWNPQVAHQKRVDARAIEELTAASPRQPAASLWRRIMRVLGEQRPSAAPADEGQR